MFVLRVQHEIGNVHRAVPVILNGLDLDLPSTHSDEDNALIVAIVGKLELLMKSRGFTPRGGSGRETGKLQAVSRK